MKIAGFFWSTGVIFALSLSTAFGQTSSTTPSGTTPSATPATQPPPTIQQRKRNQQNRIANGIDNGSLTAGETKKLEKGEANLNQEERAMRAGDGGKLTSADRTALNQQQNSLSKQIYADKHNANTAHYGNGEIGQRRENQQDRIAQGIRSGQMTPGEAARTEKKEQGINREVAGMRQANGGKLTKGDRRVVNQQQNQVSKQIYKQKHNDKKGF
jgi:hypothetical protein